MGGQKGPAPKRARTAANSASDPGGGGAGGGASSSSGPRPAQPDLTQLPQELLLLIVGNLTPRECHGLRLSCRVLRSLLDANVATTLTVTNSIAQYVLLAEQQHYRSGVMGSSNGWVSALLQKFPAVKQLDVKCTQAVLAIFAKHLVRDCGRPAGQVSLERVLQLAENVLTNSRRHSAVLLCELLKLKVAESVPAPRALGLDRMMYGKAEQVWCVVCGVCATTGACKGRGRRVSGRRAPRQGWPPPPEHSMCVGRGRSVATAGTHLARRSGGKYCNARVVVLRMTGGCQPQRWHHPHACGGWAGTAAAWLLGFRQATPCSRWRCPRLWGARGAEASVVVA